MRERRFEDALREYRLAEEGWRSIASLSLRLETQRYADSRNELERLRVLQRDLAQAASRAEARAETGGSANPGRYTREVMELDGRIRALEAMNAPVPKTNGEPPGDLFFFQGNALFDLRKTEEAIAVWEIAAKAMQEFAPVQNNLAVAYWKSGRIDDAWTSLRRAEALGFKVNPSFRADLERAGTVPRSPAR
jgi:tetratricopeptide (TPR) repeat protein